MTLDENAILARAGELYGEAKYGQAWAEHKPVDQVFGNPVRGEIQSRQVRALLQALVEAINAAGI